VFGADLEPAVSANPYFQFKIKPEKSGTLKFTWIDDDGTKIEATEQIKVT
jgi:sulfur-oxidizing protein SoxZ